MNEREEEQRIFKELSAYPQLTDLIQRVAQLNRAITSRALENTASDDRDVRINQGKISGFRYFETLTKRCSEARESGQPENKSLDKT